MRSAASCAAVGPAESSRRETERATGNNRPPGGGRLFQRAVPHFEHLVPGLLGCQRVVDRPLGKRETVLGAGEYFQLVLDAVLFQQTLEFAGDMRRDAAVGLGEGVVEFAPDPVKQQ